MLPTSKLYSNMQVVNSEHEFCIVQVHPHVNYMWRTNHMQNAVRISIRAFFSWCQSTQSHCAVYMNSHSATSKIITKLKNSKSLYLPQHSPKYDISQGTNNSRNTLCAQIETHSLYLTINNMNICSWFQFLMPIERGLHKQTNSSTNTVEQHDK